MPNWRTEYPHDLERLLESRYRLAVALMQTDEYTHGADALSQDVHNAIADYREMRDALRDAIKKGGA